MATNNDVKPERPDQPWWSQGATTAEGGAGSKGSRDGGTVAPTGATVAPSGGLLGMPAEFGRYRVLSKLGGGGMGAVYLVENTELKRQEALKVPHFTSGGDPEVRERFLREARAAAQLDHPNLCPVYDVGAIDGVCFLTMRYLKGKLLSDFTGKPQPPRKAVEIAAKLAQALESAHGKGVIHRDLKPNNVMMCAGVGPVVMDFGLARQTKSEDQRLTQSGTTMGTPSYMPPEQIKGELERIGPASDVYSLGVILFELLTGRLPFKAPTVAEVYGLVLHTQAPTPSSLRAELNLALDAILTKALAKNPADRYSSMKAFAAALIDFLKAAPAAEGAGNLSPIRAGAADIFQAATVAPNQAAASTPGLTRQPTQPGNKRPSSVRVPAVTQRATPQVTAAAVKEGRSSRRVLIIAVLIFLAVSAMGGVACLIYVLNQKKGTPNSDEVASAKPIVFAEAEKVFTLPKDGLPTTHLPGNGQVNKPVGNGFSGGGASTLEPADGGFPTGDPLDEPKRRTPPNTTVTRNPRPPAKQPPPHAVPRKMDQPEPTFPPLTPFTADPRKPAPKPEESNETVLFSEDFAGLEVGARPKGWNAPDFTVESENDRRCLEVTKQAKASNQVFYLDLPKLAIKGDFAVECELRLCGGNAPSRFGFGGITRASPADQQFHLQLLDNRNSPPLKVAVDYLANVQIDAGAKKATEGFTPLEPIHFRLARKEDVYGVSINGNVVFGQTVPRKGVFQTVRIGLTGGKPVYPGAFPAGLYSVKVTSPEALQAKPERAVVTTAGAPAIDEDFSKAAVGVLPEGWKANKSNLAVQKTGESAALELVNPVSGSDQVTLPRVDLKGGFNAKLAAVLTDPDTSVEVFFKGTRTKTLVVGMAYGGAVTMAGLREVDASKAWMDGKPNILRVEHAGPDKEYVVKLNDQEVGAVPAATASGPFTKVELTLLIKDAKNKSPRVTLFQIVPLEEER